MINTIREVRKNELLMFFSLARKALAYLSDEKPGKGVVFNRGTENETRMKYSEALLTLKKMESYFSVTGALSFGICGDCTRFDTTAHNSIGDCFGDCKIAGKLKEIHAFNSCDKHSLKGGCYGKN